MLAHIARTCFRRRRLVFVTWIVVLVAAIAGGSALAGHWASADDGPKSLLTNEFPGPRRRRRHDRLHRRDR